MWTDNHCVEPSALAMNLIDARSLLCANWRSYVHHLLAIIVIVSLVAGSASQAQSPLGSDAVVPTTRQDADNAVRGRVVENVSHAPLAQATIMLVNVADSSQCCGTSTDDDGHFRIRLVPPGVYRMRVSYVGYGALETAPFQAGREPVDLGEMRLELRPLIGGTIKVRGETPTFDNAIDRKVYDVRKDLLSQSGSAADVLQNIPSVTVDVEGNVSLRGSPNVAIFVNGAPSLLMKKSSAAALQQMPANSIERIEVITNPSAKYKPEGVGGIINIVLKRESESGVNGTLTANVGNGSRYNGNISFNCKPGRGNVFGSYGLRRGYNPRVSTTARTSRDSLNSITGTYDYRGSAYSRPLGHVATLGLDYEFDDKNQLSIAGNYFYRSSYLSQHARTIMRDSIQTILTELAASRVNDEVEKEYEVTSSYERSFENDDHSIKAEFNYSGYDEKEDNRYQDRYALPVATVVDSRNLIRTGGHLIELNAEYTYPMSDETHLEAGYAGEFQRDDISNLGELYDTLQERWTTDKNKTNRFVFDQAIHAGYITLGHTMGDLSVLAGLRAEQALIKSHLVTGDSTIPDDYFRVYPTLHLALKFDDHHELQLNYSRRIRRADSDEHNPFAEYTDPRNLEAGNPKIKPEQTHSVEFGYQFHGKDYSLLPSVYYRYTYDAFTEIQRYVNDSTKLSTSANLSTKQSAGLEVVATYSWRSHLSLNMSTNVFHEVIDASNLGYSDRKGNTTWDARLIANLRLTPTNLIQVNVSHRSGRISPQGTFDPLFLINLGLRQDLWRNRASITLTVSDVFNALTYRSHIDTPDLQESAEYRRNARVLYLGFIYRLSTKKDESREDLQFEDKI